MFILLAHMLESRPHSPPLAGSFLHVCGCCCSDFRCPLKLFLVILSFLLSLRQLAARELMQQPGLTDMAGAFWPQHPPTATSQSLALMSVLSPGKPSHQRELLSPRPKDLTDLSLSPTQQCSHLLSSQRAHSAPRSFLQWQNWHHDLRTC